MRSAECGVQASLIEAAGVDEWMDPGRSALSAITGRKTSYPESTSRYRRAQASSEWDLAIRWRAALPMSIRRAG
jgi:hypothetical protein